MRQAKKERQKFQFRIPFILDPGKKIPKKMAKNQKTFFQYNFQPKRAEIGREREENILVPNSVDTRPGQENSEKKQHKNSKNLKKLLLALFLAKTG